MGAVKSALSMGRIIWVEHVLQQYTDLAHIMTAG